MLVISTGKIHAKRDWTGAWQFRWAVAFIANYRLDWCIHTVWLRYFLYRELPAGLVRSVSLRCFLYRELPTGLIRSVSLRCFLYRETPTGLVHLHSLDKAFLISRTTNWTGAFTQFRWTLLHGANHSLDFYVTLGDLSICMQIMLETLLQNYIFRQ
jgi:hypothetical protein